MSVRYGTCEGLPHDWTDFQPGYAIMARSGVRIPERVEALMRSRLSETEPWRTCLRCFAFITWNEWYAAVEDLTTA